MEREDPIKKLLDQKKKLEEAQKEFYRQEKEALENEHVLRTLIDMRVFRIDYGALKRRYQ